MNLENTDFVSASLSEESDSVLCLYLPCIFLLCFFFICWSCALSSPMESSFCWVFTKRDTHLP